MSGSGRGQLLYSHPCPPLFATSISQRVSPLPLSRLSRRVRPACACGREEGRAPALRSRPLPGRCNLPPAGHGEGPGPRSPPRSGAPAAASAGQARAPESGRGGGRRGGPAAAGRGLARVRRLTGPAGREALAGVAHLGGVADLEQVQPVRVPVVDDVGEFAPLLLPAAAAAARHPRRARRRRRGAAPGPGPGPLSRAPDGAGGPSVPAGKGKRRLSPRPLPA